MTYQNKCIKCGADYDSDIEGDEDYCVLCREQNKAIAKEVDAKIALRRANEPPRPAPRTYEPTPGTDIVEINYRQLR